MRRFRSNIVFEVPFGLAHLRCPMVSISTALNITVFFAIEVYLFFGSVIAQIVGWSMMPSSGRPSPSCAAIAVRKLKSTSTFYKSFNTDLPLNIFRRGLGAPMARAARVFQCRPGCAFPQPGRPMSGAATHAGIRTGSAKAEGCSLRQQWFDRQLLPTGKLSADWNRGQAANGRMNRQKMADCVKVPASIDYMQATVASGLG